MAVNGQELKQVSIRVKTVILHSSSRFPGVWSTGS